jgi:serine protease Do
MTRATLRIALASAGRCLLVLQLLALAGPARAERGAPAQRPDAGSGLLHEFNRAMIRLSERVSPSVVQVQVTGFHPTGQAGKVESAFVSRQHAIGSGVIVDPDGYILTNNHVVSGAQRVQVLIPAAAGGAPGDDDAGRRLFDARVVGTEPNADLALLKIEAKGLHALSLAGAVPVHQGEMVFAVGSPEGLERTITMGIVSAPAREVEMEQHMEFIQTDAPINPGNSGGPLVNVDGALVGINSFFVSESGGSQGLGFAIPAAMAKLVYESLRKEGHVHLVDAGLSLQAIDRPLARGLALPRDWGVVVADVELDGPARAAGILPGDVIASIDGHPIPNLAAATTARYLHRPGQPVRFVLLRGDGQLTVTVDGKEKPHLADLTELAAPEKSLVRPLGIIGVTVTPELRGMIHGLLIGKGVVVVARTLDMTAVESGLQTGDVIHAVNRKDVDSVEGLRTLLRGFRRGDPVAIQIERDGKLAFLSFEME